METLGLKVMEIPTDTTSGVDLNHLEKALVKKAVQACIRNTCGIYRVWLIIFRTIQRSRVRKADWYCGWN